MELLVVLAFAAGGATLMKRNGLSWIEGALWGGILTLLGLIIILFRIKSHKQKIERHSLPEFSSESQIGEGANVDSYAPQNSFNIRDANSQAILVLKQKATSQLLFGLAWWIASAIAMYFALASTDSTILWFGGAFGALFHWYRVLRIVEVARIERVKFLGQREYAFILVVLLVVVGSVSKIVPEYFRIDAPTVGTCWAEANLGFYSPIACWSDKATLRTISFSPNELGCGRNKAFAPDSREELFTCLEEIRQRS